jgi:GAF domain-containing protein
MARDEERSRLAKTLGDLAVHMQAQRGTEDTLRAIVEAATHVVPGTLWAGISLLQGHRLTSKAPTHPAVPQLDAIQAELGDGPCITALREHHTVHVPDMAAETRWPEFTRRAMEMGVRSLLSFQLFVENENLGALNLYGGEPGVFSGDSFEAGAILAQHAAVALAGATKETQFRSALASRDVIGQAKGILMHREGLTGLQAFALLTRTSQETNVKLADVARWLVKEHEDNVG